MKNTLKICHKDGVIVMDATFAKKSENTMSAEYAHLQQVRRDYPTYKVIRHTIKRNAEKKTYKGLTYEYMEYYILTHGTKEEKQKNFAEYNEMILISKCHGKPNPSLYADLAFILSSHRYLCFLRDHLHQRRSVVEVLDDIRIVNGTILFRHIQRRMAEQGLKRKSISSAIHKIFPSEGVPEQVNGSLLNTTPSVVFGNRTAQPIFRHHFTCIIGKEIIVWLTFADLDVFTQNRNHHGAQRRDLRSLVLGVLEINHAILKVKVFVLNQTDCPRSVSAVEKIVDDDPVPILRKCAGAQIGLFEKEHQFIIRVGFFDNLLAAIKCDIGLRQPFAITPTQETFERSGITVDGSILHPGRPHSFNHLIERTLE